MIDSSIQDTSSLVVVALLSKVFGSKARLLIISSEFPGVSALMDLNANPPEPSEPKTFNSAVSAAWDSSLTRAEAKSSEVVSEVISRAAVLISGFSDSFRMGLPNIKNTIPSRKRSMMSD